MESSVWNKLPRDLQNLVLQRLPLLDLCRFSFTCNYFHSLLSHPSFAIHYDRHRLANTVFVASIWLSNRKSVIWQQGGNVMLPWQSPVFDYLHGFHWLLKGYGDGFVCFRGPFTHNNLLVFNPLFPHESTILNLPAPLDYQHILHTAIAFDRKNGVCKLVSWCRLSDNRIITGVYSFKEGTWKRITRCNRSGKDLSIGRCAQLVNERFLCWLCTDLTSSVNTVLVFDVEEEMWEEPIPLGNSGSFICLIQHEKQLCLISRRTVKKEKSFGLWKLDLKQRVFELLEFIRPPTTRETNYWGGQHLLKVNAWSPGFFRVEECNIKEKSFCTWVYDILHHSWQDLGDLGRDYDCFEGSLFRLAV